MADNLVPDYEVKALVNSDLVLDADHNLSQEFITKLNVTKTPKKRHVQYLETDDKAFDAQGWNNRIRAVQGETSLDLTYKKRYRVADGDIDAALDLANSEGFDATDDNYEAQVDWGYSQQTLSLTRKKSYKAGLAELELPDQAESIAIMIDKIPGKLDKWVYTGWGTETFERSRIYGPVLYTRYKGEFQGVTLDIEIWPIRSADGAGIDYITEISFKEDEFAVASAVREALYAYLDEEGVLEHRDSLKTQLILARY